MDGVGWQRGGEALRAEGTAYARFCDRGGFHSQGLKRKKAQAQRSSTLMAGPYAQTTGKPGGNFRQQGGMENSVLSR